MADDAPKTTLYPGQFERMQWLYEGAARALCRMKGIDPDGSIADGGHMAWHLVGYEAACVELPEGPKGD